MAKRPTIKDLAQAAGLGVATVDRALNGRAHVRQATLDQVLEAAEAKQDDLKSFVAKMVEKIQLNSPITNGSNGTE